MQLLIEAQSDSNSVTFSSFDSLQLKEIENKSIEKKLSKEVILNLS